MMVADSPGVGTSKLRVIHYGMSPNLGGIETYLLNLARNLGSEIHSDFLFSDYGRLPWFAPELKPTGSQFFGVTPRRVSILQNRRDLVELFRREAFDILHFHANTVSYVAPLRAALGQGVRVILHSHNAGASRSRLTRALHNYHRQTIPWSRITRAAVSNEAGRWMFGKRTFDVIHNGIDIEGFAFKPNAREDVRATWGASPSDLVVGQVGVFLPAKNHLFALSVFCETLRRRPEALLVLVGDGPGQEDIRARALELGVAHRVQFLGRRSDMPRVMAGFDVLLMPSLHEGFPIVTIEAQASGLPCLLSDHITPEVVVSPSCTRLSLTVPASVWAERAVASNCGDRLLGQQAVMEAGYSLEANAAAVGNLYRRAMASSNP